MRLSTLALFLCAAPAMFCQSPTPGPANPGKQWSLPPEFAQPGRDFRKPPPNWGTLNILPRSRIIVPRAGADRLQNSGSLDRKMIIRPPQSSLGEQPPGTQVAQNFYPNLRILPIDWPKAKLEEIPVEWPNLKLESIPTTSCVKLTDVSANKKSPPEK